MANNNNDFSSIFWNGIVAGAILYFLTDSFSLAAAIAVAAMLIIWLLKKANRQAQQQEPQEQEYHEVETEKYAFDFDSLSPTYKSQLLKQQFDYFFGYRSMGNNRLEFYCAEDELDGYRFSFWIDYLIDNTSNTVKVKVGDPVCIVYISSNKGRAFGYEQFTIRASVDGVVSGFYKGTLQKNGVIFRIKSGSEEELDAAIVQEIPQVESTISFADALDGLSVENENIEVEKLDDVLKWEMPDVGDIEMPEEEESGSDYDASVGYHATITNLSDFDWCNFRAICYSSVDETQKEVKRIGDIRIGAKTLLSSRYDMFYLEGENASGEQKRFRPFALEKDSDITITTIFIERD